MSRLKVDNIETRSGNNVAMDNALQLKSYTTAQRDALSSPQAGDTIYNSDEGTIDFYNGTSWNATSSSTFTFSAAFLVVGLINLSISVIILILMLSDFKKQRCMMMNFLLS